MLKRIDLRRVAAVVAETLGRKFRHIRIIKVDVANDVNRDGEDILRIDIVFDGQIKEVDARQDRGRSKELAARFVEN